MAISGTFKANVYSDLYLEFIWESVNYDPIKSQSTINWTLQSVGNSKCYEASSILVKIDKEIVYSTSQNDKIELCDKTIVANGTKIISHDLTEEVRVFGVNIEVSIDNYITDWGVAKNFSLDPFYNIEFDANGGVGAPDAQIKIHGIGLKLSDKKPTKSGYTFLGWSTDLLDTSISYEAGGIYTLNESITLYAQWKKISSVTITLDASTNGGLVNGLASIVKNVSYNNIIGYLPDAVKKNCKFLGWFTAPEGGTKILAHFLATSDRIFYAQFEPQANCYIKQDNYIEAMMYRKIDGIYKTGIVKVRKNGTYSDISM